MAGEGVLLGFVDASVAVDFYGAKGFFKPGEFGLGEGDFGGFEVFEDSFFVLGSRDRDDVGVFIEHPCEGNLRGRGFFHFGEFFEEFYDRTVAFEVFFGELRDEFSDVVSAEFGFGGDFAGEKAAGEGREGHDADVMLDAIREDFLFAVSFDHGVQVLHGGDGRDFMGFGKDGNIDLGEAPAADFSFPDQTAHAFCDFLDRNGFVEAM